MPVAVNPDLVAGGGDLRRELGMPGDLLADEIEGGADSRSFELGQHGGRALGVGPVVEGDREAASGQA